MRDTVLRVPSDSHSAGSVLPFTRVVPGDTHSRVIFEASNVFRPGHGSGKRQMRNSPWATEMRV